MTDEGDESERRQLSHTMSNARNKHHQPVTTRGNRSTSVISINSSSKLYLPYGLVQFCYSKLDLKLCEYLYIRTYLNHSMIPKLWKQIVYSVK